MPARRLEDRIKELCARARKEREPQWSNTMYELQLAIREHHRRLLRGEHLEGERRKAFQLEAKSKSKKAEKPTIELA